MYFEKIVNKITIDYLCKFFIFSCFLTSNNYKFIIIVFYLIHLIILYAILYFAPNFIILNLFYTNT